MRNLLESGVQSREKKHLVPFSCDPFLAGLVSVASGCVVVLAACAYKRDEMSEILRGTQVAGMTAPVCPHHDFRRAGQTQLETENERTQEKLLEVHEQNKTK